MTLGVVSVAIWWLGDIKTPLSLALIPHAVPQYGLACVLLSSLPYFL